MKVKIFSAKFPEFGRPRFTDTLKFPNDITQLTAKNVSELIGKYTQLYTFANAEVSRITHDLLSEETNLSLRRISLLRSKPHLNAQERWRRDAVIDSDDAVIGYSLRIMALKQKKELALMARENFDRYINALSRELTRKTHEEPRSRFLPQ